MTDILHISPSDDSPDDPCESVDDDSTTDAETEADSETILQFSRPIDAPSTDGITEESDDGMAGEPDELELAYRQALEMIDEAEWEIGQALSEMQDDDSFQESTTDELVEETVGLEESGSLEDAAAGLVDEFFGDQQVEEHRLSPAQIIEAAMFVGGQPLTAKKLAGLLRGNFNATFVEQAIAELNTRYLDEQRPYEIRLSEGGYELKLRYEFESIRHRVFGLGPKEVKLSQDALEVLSLVAYHQPMSVPDIEDAGKEKPNGTLRQLLRRGLVALERGEKNRKKVKYVTTDRFLQVFGLGDIEELPLLGDLDFK
ncbi:MAG: SMC-Scp complex subunit ScpB [Planctomycetota bacterium]|nr:SMC-Scp complex subunit ScpB [Planctomycetota bacterium]